MKLIILSALVLAGCSQTPTEPPTRLEGTNWYSIHGHMILVPKPGPVIIVPVPGTEYPYPVETRRPVERKK